MPDFIELFASLTSIAFVYLGAKQNPWCWPVGLLGVVGYTVVFYQGKLYADMGLQLVYALQSFYGWYIWLRFGQAKKEEKLNQRLSLVGWISCLLFSSLLSWGIYELLLRYTDSDMPLGDSLATAFAISANFLLAKKYIENWLWWIVIDSFLAALLYQKELYISAATYLLFAGMAVYAYREWRKREEEQPIFV